MTLDPQRPHSVPASALALCLLLAAAGCSPRDPGEEGSRRNAAAAESAAGSAESLRRLGDGFLVWESNRTGAWRIWTRRFDGSPSEQLTPEEPGRQHCCPHVSPEGRWIAYLSLGIAPDDYPSADDAGRLHLISPGGQARLLAEDAHTYFENRAVVWRNEGELIYLGERGSTLLLDVASGERRVLLPSRPGEYGRLIDAELGYASAGAVSFDPYLPARREIARRTPLAGCQPYFSHDGRWGFWTAGAGGPVKRLELASRAISEILAKNDPRLPEGLGYVYFPMLSRDGMLFAFAASDGAHDHFRSDYEIFVAESDPETLELVGEPLRATFHPATDRFPDAFLRPLALGRRFGEAPLTVRFEAAGGEDWEWSFGDGTREGRRGRAVEHRYIRPGSWGVEARGEGGVLRGRVVVREPRPPRVVATRLTNEGRRLEVRFDEPVELEAPHLELASGRAVAGWSASADGRGLVLELAEPHRGLDRLRLDGIRDRAERPNPMPAVTLDLEPPSWPSRRQGLVFLWQTGVAPNLVEDGDGGPARAATVERRGPARLDRNWAMRPSGGTFEASGEVARGALLALREANELTLELVVTPAREQAGGGAGAVVFAGDRGGWDFALTQEGPRLLWAMRLGGGVGGGRSVTEVGRLEPGATGHLVIGYGTGRLVSYLDGEVRLETDAVQGDFFPWRGGSLRFGGAGEGEARWRGRLEGIALYDRILDAEEARENYGRYRKLLDERRTPDPLVVEARRAAASRAPSLSEISPYREALAVHEYALERVLEGRPLATGERLRVVHWVVLDGRRLPVAGAPPGERVRLRLEPLAENPQLEGVYLADTLAPQPGQPLYFAIEP